MADYVRVAFVSLGCVKNLVDSEKMLGQLAEAGCVITGEDDSPDVLVINTCGFVEAARTEADEIIREAIARKASGTVKRVVVAGCLVQRDREALLERIDGIDALVGVNNRDDIVRAVVDCGLRIADCGLNSARSCEVFLSDYHPFVQLDTARLRLTPRHYAYLRISEGCDQKCTFCTIPAIRGRLHCKPPEVILAEARELLSDGAVEINLIGQDTTSYGLEEGNCGLRIADCGLADLLRRLNTVDGLAWIRLMYAYPSVLTDEMLDAIGECDRVCNYIDLPLQHINDRILKAMHRRIDRVATEKLLQRIRDRIENVTIRTTLIAGFPRETDEEFDELLTFVKGFRFDALGVFPYSLEPDTPAGKMPGQLPEAVKRERVDALMLAQQEVAFLLADKRRGSCFDVLVDETAGPGVAVGRHRGQAPQVDGVTHVEDCTAQPGTIVTVRCTGRVEYDLRSCQLSAVSRGS